MDVLGLILAVVVHSAGIQDRDGAKLILERIRGSFPRLQLIWADRGYAGQLIGWVQQVCGWVLDVIKRPADQEGFHVMPWCWIVERSFAWLGRYRRLSKDYEYLTETSEAMIYSAMIHIMIRRLEATDTS